MIDEGTPDRPETRDEDLPATHSGILDLVTQGERVGWNFDLHLSSYVFQPFWYAKALWDRQFVQFTGKNMQVP